MLRLRWLKPGVLLWRVLILLLLRPRHLLLLLLHSVHLLLHLLRLRLTHLLLLPLGHGLDLLLLPIFDSLLDEHAVPPLLDGCFIPLALRDLTHKTRLRRFRLLFALVVREA